MKTVFCMTTLAAIVLGTPAMAAPVTSADAMATGSLIVWISVVLVFAAAVLAFAGSVMLDRGDRADDA